MYILTDFHLLFSFKSKFVILRFISALVISRLFNCGFIYGENEQGKYFWNQGCRIGEKNIALNRHIYISWQYFKEFIKKKKSFLLDMHSEHILKKIVIK